MRHVYWVGERVRQIPPPYGVGGETGYTVPLRVTTWEREGWKGSGFPIPAFQDPPWLFALCPWVTIVSTAICIPFFLIVPWFSRQEISCPRKNRVGYFCSVTKECPTLCNTMYCTTPGFPVLHYIPEFAQTHVHWVNDAIQPSRPLSHSSPLALNLYQCQGLFQCVSSSHQMARVLELLLHHQSFQWIFRVDFL